MIHLSYIFVPRRFHSSLIFLLFLPAILFSQKNEPDKILFVGNSFTYMWNMPQMVEAMAKNQGVSLETAQSTVGGSNFKQHWEKEKNTKTRDLLKDKSWDYVILQGYSSGTIDNPERFTTYGTKLIDLVKEKGAEPLLFMTWAYDYNPLMQNTISSSYIELGMKTDAKVVPVGNIFMEVQKIRPNLKMYFDEKHPSSAGSYLIALIYYKYLTGKTVLGIPNLLTVPDSKGEKTYLSFVRPETGTFLRQFVEGIDIEVFKRSN